VLGLNASDIRLNFVAQVKSYGNTADESCAYFPACNLKKSVGVIWRANFKPSFSSRKRIYCPQYSVAELLPIYIGTVSGRSLVGFDFLCLMVADRSRHTH